MPKFNRKLDIRPEIRPDKTNLAGGRAFGQSPELEFASILLTSFVSGQFYRKEAETLERVSQLLDEGVSHEFAAKAAIYARDQFNMRSISHVVAAELAARVKDSQWMRPFVRDVIVRVDDMLEILAYFEGKYGRRPVPNALKRGMRDAFAKFDGYWPSTVVSAVPSSWWTWSTWSTRCRRSLTGSRSTSWWRARSAPPRPGKAGYPRQDRWMTRR
jgi:hypothetical protein